VSVAAFSSPPAASGAPHDEQRRSLDELHHLIIWLFGHLIGGLINRMAR